MILFIESNFNLSSFNSDTKLAKFYKTAEVILLSNGGCRTTVSIEACGASEGGSTPLTRPIFLNNLSCEDQLILDCSVVSEHHHC